MCIPAHCIIDREARDNDMSQGAYPSDTLSPSEEGTQGNTEYPNSRRSGHDRKTPFPYDPYFEGNRYGTQRFGMEM